MLSPPPVNRNAQDSDPHHRDHSQCRLTLAGPDCPKPSLCVCAWRALCECNQETCGQQHDAKYCTCQIDAVANAVGLSPSERREKSKRFENVSKGHNDETHNPEKGQR
jgi:hypothetical protein